MDLQKYNAKALESGFKGDLKFWKSQIILSFDFV